jgi:hypothetical protein
MRFFCCVLLFTLTGASCSGDRDAAQNGIDTIAVAPLRPPTDFEGDVAYSYVKQQVAFGSRVPGTPAHLRTGDWISAQMRARADTVIEQRWTHVTKDGKRLALRNVLARFKPAATKRVLFLAHWDSRPISDSAEDPAQRTIPVPGANDGASGVAVLLSLADALKRLPPDIGVDLLAVDGEDYGDFSSNTDVLLGSTHFADNLPSADYKPVYGILLDMIGDADLKIPYEEHSINAAADVVQRVWTTAKELGHEQVFVMQNQGMVTDDHLPLIRKGLKVIDVIDLSYCCHHKPSDTVDKVSARSLKVVGDVMLTLIRSEK